MSFRVPEKFRVDTPDVDIRPNSRRGDLFGHFLIPPSLVRGFKYALRCLASNGQDWEHMKLGGLVPEDSVPWEHVSVSLQPPNCTRCPTWEEMCYVRTLFWDPEDCVVQFHPPESEYVNESRFCLHLWRPVGIELPRPPSECVGRK